MMKSLILLVLTASAVMGHQYCQPGSFFKDDCNLCTCSLDGKSAACTDMQCIGEKSESPEKYCEPGKEFKIDECNTCTCSMDGSTAFCTLQFCAPLTKKISAAKYCKPNAVFQLDSCNTCRCSKDGSKAFCTLANCPEDKPVISNLPDQVCKPYSQFKDYCNTCSCAADGMSFACTRMMCDKNIWNQDGSLKLLVKSQKTQVCKPRTQFNDYCNVCNCNDDGSSYACTRMMCDKDIWNQDGSLKVVAKSQMDQVCKPLSQFKNYCNTCGCAADGMSFACTRMFCNKDIWNQDGSLKVLAKSQKTQVCKPRTQFNDYCNICTCNDDGFSYACTRMLCDKDIWNQDGSLKVKSQSNQVCKPRTQFNDYCNICTCNEDGSSYACTMMFCDKDIWNQDGSKKVVAKSQKSQVCKPYSQFKDYCNTCRCAADGMSFACTRMMCDKDIWNQDGSLKVLVKSQKTQTCKPRTQFNDYCNICTCNDDGTSYACTMMFCDKNIWNQDGSKKVIAKDDQTVELERTCEPGSVFSPDSCNTCICNADGTKMACTTKLCMSNLNKAYELENTEEWGPIYEEGDKCTPGKLFYSECNRCVCGDSGNTAYCTYMKCPSKVN